jgi:hypothetical protein
VWPCVVLARRESTPPPRTTTTIAFARAKLFPCSTLLHKRIWLLLSLGPLYPYPMLEGAAQEARERVDGGRERQQRGEWGRTFHGTTRTFPGWRFSFHDGGRESGGAREESGGGGGSGGEIWRWRRTTESGGAREESGGRGDDSERARRLRARAGLATRFGDGGRQQRAGVRERRAGAGRRQNRVPKIVDVYTNVLSSSRDKLS